MPTALQNEMTLAQAVNEALEKSFDLTRSLSAELAPPVLYEDGLAAALEVAHKSNGGTLQN